MKARKARRLGHCSPNLHLPSPISLLLRSFPPTPLLLLRPLSCTEVTGLPRKLIYGKRRRRKKNYKCSYSPAPAAQFSGIRRARGSGVCDNCQGKRGAITKGHSSLNVTLRARGAVMKQPSHSRRSQVRAPLFIPIHFTIKLQMR